MVTYTCTLTANPKNSFEVAKPVHYEFQETDENFMKVAINYIDAHHQEMNNGERHKELKRMEGGDIEWIIKNIPNGIIQSPCFNGSNFKYIPEENLSKKKA